MSELRTWVLRFRWLNIRSWQVVLVSLLGLGSAVSEGLGIGMMLPVLEFADKGRDVAHLVQGSRHWQIISTVYQTLHLPLTLLTIMVPVFLFAFARQLFMYVRQVYCAALQYRVMERIQRQAFERFACADLAFINEFGVGRLINAVTMDGSRAGTAVQFFFDLIAVQVLVGCYLALLVALSGWSVLIAAGVMVLIGWFMRRLMAWSRHHGQAISQFNADLQRALVELLSGLRLVKLADREADAVTKVERLLRGLREQMVILTKIAGRTRMLVEPVAMLILLVALFFAVELLELSLARIGLFAIVVIRLVPLARSVLDTRQALVSFLPSFESVQGLIQAAERAQTIRGGSRRFPGLQRQLRFEAVQFRYPNATEEALRDVTLTISAFRMAALVGHSGAGKSTLVDLIPRLIQPTRGRILADGVPLEEFTLSSLRRQVAFVPQEGIVFDDTVANNIRYGRPDATDAEVREAARMAHADEFIERLPQRYATPLGERGIRLSVGQRQRISLARALLQRASVLILDEPTSALDSETEQGIQESLEAMRREGQTTIIVIAHRLSTIYRADLIVVLDHGRVVEAGTHAQLTHNDEWYARVLERQMMPEIEEAKASHA